MLAEFDPISFMKNRGLLDHKRVNDEPKPGLNECSVLYACKPEISVTIFKTRVLF